LDDESSLARHEIRFLQRTGYAPRTTTHTDAWVRGKELFFATNEPGISTDGRGCATCHIDGRDDNVVWDSPKGPRRTLSLAAVSDRSGPFGWKSENADRAAHMKASVTRLRGRGLPDQDVYALEEYVRSLAATPASEPTNALVKQGRDIFRSPRAACSNCHIEERGFSDHESHHVGTGAAYKTPTLVGVGAKTAWGHDGRFKSLEDMLSGTTMGHYRALDLDQRRQLVAYLASL